MIISCKADIRMEFVQHIKWKSVYEVNIFHSLWLYKKWTDLLKGFFLSIFYDDILI